jgi:hypothetical protein
VRPARLAIFDQLLPAQNYPSTINDQDYTVMTHTHEGPELLSRQDLQKIAYCWYRQSPRRIQLPSLPVNLSRQLKTQKEMNMFVNKTGRYIDVLVKCIHCVISVTSLVVIVQVLVKVKVQPRIILVVIVDLQAHS